MQNYFLQAARGREKHLRTAQIPFEPFRIEQQDGFVFEDIHLPQVLAALNSAVERQEDSQYIGIRVLHLTRNRNGANAAAPVVPATVTVEEWSNESSNRTKDDFVNVAREFSTLLSVNEIVLIDTRQSGNHQETRGSAGKFNVFFWSAASGKSHDSDENGRVTVTMLWEYPLVKRWRIWYPSGRGTVIKDPAGTEVAELVGENLYIHYPITNAGLPDGANIFRRILEETIILLGMTPEEAARKRLELQRQRDEQLRAEARANPVVVKRWNSEQRGSRDKFVAVATEFSQVLGEKPILIYDYCERLERHRPSTDGRINICIWSSSDDLTGDGNMKSVLFGERLEWEERESVLLPSGDGGTILTDEDENQVGKVMGDTIYIHYPLTKRYVNLKWGGKGPEALFRRILEEVVFLKTATEKEKAARARAFAEKHRARSREEYITACNHRFDKFLDESRKAVEANPAKVREHQMAIVMLIREEKEAQQRLQNMDKSRAEALVAHAKEFDKLVGVPKIRDVRVHGDVIQVFTDTLYCVDPRTNKKHEIGAFRIEIHIGGNVFWFNLTRHVDGYNRSMNAPHVFPNGNACLGNMAEVIPQLAANYEFAALAMIAIQFIENVNTDDAAGQHINKWPVAA